MIDLCNGFMVSHLYVMLYLFYIKNDFWHQITLQCFAKFSSRVEVELPQEGTAPPPESGCPKLLSPMSHSPTALSSDTVFSISLVPQFQFWGISPNVGIWDLFPKHSQFLRSSASLSQEAIWRGIRSLAGCLSYPQAPQRKKKLLGCWLP